MPGSTARLGLPYSQGGDLAASIDDTMQDLAEELDDQVVSKTHDQDRIFAPGDLKPVAYTDPDPGWLRCDGAPVSRGTYAALFAKIGTTYGAGNGVSTFNLPDLRGRVPVGADGPAGRLSANDALGQAGGEEKHQLSIGELASHEHGVRLDSAASPSRGLKFTDGAGQYIATGGGADDVLQNAGGDQPHNNMPPYQIVNWMIKT